MSDKNLEQISGQLELMTRTAQWWRVAAIMLACLLVGFVAFVGACVVWLQRDANMRANHAREQAEQAWREAEHAHEAAKAMRDESER